jgi:hypothetical protein
LWSSSPNLRLRRGLRVILSGAPEAVLMAPERGRGVGFNFHSHQVAVTWDAGKWGLLYGLDALQGADVIVDGQVAGSAYRGAMVRPLELVRGAARRVALRFRFDDPVHVDFTLELWQRKKGERRSGSPPDEAVAEAAHWLGRVDGLLNRSDYSWWEAPPTPAAQLAAPPQSGPQNVRLLRRFVDQVDTGSFRDEEAA